jgi:hypothetical protein
MTIHNALSLAKAKHANDLDRTGDNVSFHTFIFCNAAKKEKLKSFKHDILCKLFR